MVTERVSSESCDLHHDTWEKDWWVGNNSPVEENDDWFCYVCFSKPSKGEKAIIVKGLLKYWVWASHLKATGPGGLTF